MLEFPVIDPIALQIGPLAIRWYALAYLGGILLGWLYADRLVRRTALWPQGKAPGTPEQISDFVRLVAHLLAHVVSTTDGLMTYLGIRFRSWADLSKLGIGKDVSPMRG